MNGFTGALRRRAQEGYMPIVPDFKQISPSDGPLLQGHDILKAARIMESMGAPALSVVTEPEQFGGSLELLSQITQAVQIPVLRKDFIQSRADVEETSRCGAKAVLLICARLNGTQLRELYHAALDCGLEPLVEAHSREELRLAAALGAGLVGINNRDILSLERDGGTVRTTARLAAERPEGAFLISESGIRNADDIRIARQSGANAILMGTAIWKASDPFQFYQTLSQVKE